MNSNRVLIGLLAPGAADNRTRVTFEQGLVGSRKAIDTLTRRLPEGHDMEVRAVELSDLALEEAATQLPVGEERGHLSYDMFEAFISALEEEQEGEPVVPEARSGVLERILSDPEVNLAELVVGASEMPPSARLVVLDVATTNLILGRGFGEPPSEWSKVRWDYKPRSLVPRRNAKKYKLPLHAPEFDRHWAHAYRAALLVAGGCRPGNSIPLLRVWFGNPLKYLRIPRWARSLRLATLLSRYPQKGPTDLATLDDWFPRPTGLPTLRDDLDTWTEHTERRLFNGFAPLPLQRAPDGTLVLNIRWDNVDLKRRTILPGVQARWRTKEGGRPELHQIIVEKRRQRSALPAGLSPKKRKKYFETTVYDRSKSNDTEWWWALYVLRSVALVAGQLDVHLARCHLLLESFALMVETKPGFPPRIKKVLAPFIRDVTGVNRVGDALVFQGPGVLPRMTGLDDDAIAARLAHQLGEVDWRGFEPRQGNPILEDDKLSEPGRIFWEGIRLFVGDQLADITENELRVVQKAVMKHNTKAPPVRAKEPLPHHEWVWPGEVADGGRAEHLSVPQSAAEVREMCRFVIYHASFFHSWVNDQGWTDGGSLLHACFGLRKLEPPPSREKEYIYRWLERRLPKWRRCVPQLAVGWALYRVRWGVIGNMKDRLSAETVDKENFGETEVVQAFVDAFGDPKVEGSLRDRLKGKWDFETTRIRINT